jgi:hypothetical protein
MKNLRAADSELLACFNMPTGLTITGRVSSIRNAFVAAIIPPVYPTVSEIRAVLSILGMEPANLRCAYCGDPASEWDHLRPLVTDGRPTGYPSSIRNLVPACGKCNQSKGKSDWRAWMLSAKTKRSPTRRGVKGIRERIRRLEKFEKWADCCPLDIPKLVDAKMLSDYYRLQKKILHDMYAAQALAMRIKVLIAASLSQALPSASARRLVSLPLRSNQRRAGRELAPRGQFPSIRSRS